MGIKLHVRVQEARNLAAKDSNGLSDPYVRLQLGSSKAKSKIIYKNLNPVWNEEYFFNVEDVFSEQLHLTVWDSDFGLTDDFLGQLSLPLSEVYDAEHRSVDAWYTLEPRKAKEVVSGDIRLTLSLIGKVERSNSSGSSTSGSASFSRRSSISSPSSSSFEESKRSAEKLSSPSKAPKRGLFSRRFSRADSEKSGQLARLESTSSVASSTGEFDGELAPESFWEDDGKGLGPPVEMPQPLAGGILGDSTYKISPKELNGILFGNGSEFEGKLFAACKLTKGTAEPWHIGEEGYTRRVTYLTAPSTLIKSVKATEIQVYSNPGGGGFVVDITRSTPDAPYGGTFRTKIQICIFPGPEDPLRTSRLRISYEPEFLQTTSLRGVIEKGMAQGMKETYFLYLEILRFFAPEITAPSAVQKGMVSNCLKQLQERFYLVAAIFSSFFLLLFSIHIFLVRSRTRAPQGLEPYLLGLDLPDSVRELVLTWVVVALAHVVLVKVEVKARARLLKFGDHGIRAQGEGWLLTVALTEGVNLPKADVTGFSDPYVVFTCNGKTRTSSVKLQTLNPEWNEILEFDAMEDPPTVMTLEVFDYDGPFSEAELLGRAEINFLKRSGADLADLWIDLEGRRAKAANSRLHMRVILNNTANDSGDGESYVSSKLLEKVKSETGRTLTHSSSQKNAAFQHLFSLPEHETLLNDYVCAIKKKFNVQGRVFLSPRQLGFFANCFGHKTQFSIAWEDIDEIRENSTSVSKFTRLLNPYVTLYTRKGRALDAKAGSYGVDNRGRLKFRFQSFVKPGPAIRTIQVLWKNRACSPEQCAEKVAEATKDLRSDDSVSSDGSEDGPFLAIEEPEMTLASEIDVPIGKQELCRMFEEDKLDERVAEARGLVNYEHTPWEPLEDRVPPTFRREVSYNYPRRVCPFGSRVTSICQLTKVNDDHVIIEEISTLHDVPFGNLFQVQTKRIVKKTGDRRTHIQALVGVSFHKKTRFQNRIRSSVIQHNVRDLTETANIIVTEVIKSVQCGEGPAIGG